jgi:hypothetical protein
MPSARSLVLALAVPVAALALTACDKPAPSATIFSGSTSEHREALCWSFDADRAYTADDCAVDVAAAQSQQSVFDALDEYLATLEVAPGDVVGISVDPEVAETGWSVTVNGRPLHRELLTETYFRFTMPPQPLRQGSAELQIQAAAEDGTSARGFWVFRLADESASD